MKLETKVTEDLLLDKLPHGSGIDCDWKITENKGYFKCENSYHLMNDNGYYVGYIDFSVVISKSKPYDFKLHFHTNSNGRRMIEQNDLRSYLDDTIAYSLESLWIKETQSFLANEQIKFYEKEGNNKC